MPKEEGKALDKAELEAMFGSGAKLTSNPFKKTDSRTEKDAKKNIAAVNDGDLGVIVAFIISHPETLDTFLNMKTGLLKAKFAERLIKNPEDLKQLWNNVNKVEAKNDVRFQLAKFMRMLKPADYPLDSIIENIKATPQIIGNFFDSDIPGRNFLREIIDAGKLGELLSGNDIITDYFIVSEIEKNIVINKLNEKDRALLKGKVDAFNAVKPLDLKEAIVNKHYSNEYSMNSIMRGNVNFGRGSAVEILRGSKEALIGVFNGKGGLGMSSIFYVKSLSEMIDNRLPYNSVDWYDLLSARNPPSSNKPSIRDERIREGIIERLLRDDSIELKKMCAYVGAASIDAVDFVRVLAEFTDKCRDAVAKSFLSSVFSVPEIRERYFRDVNLMNLDTLPEVIKKYLILDPLSVSFHRVALNTENLEEAARKLLNSENSDDKKLGRIVAALLPNNNLRYFSRELVSHENLQRDITRYQKEGTILDYVKFEKVIMDCDKRIQEKEERNRILRDMLSKQKKGGDEDKIKRELEGNNKDIDGQRRIKSENEAKRGELQLFLLRTSKYYSMLQKLDDIIRSSNVNVTDIQYIKSVIKCPQEQDLLSFVQAQMSLIESCDPKIKGKLDCFKQKSEGKMLDVYVYPDLNDRLRLNPGEVVSIGDLHGSQSKLVYELILNNVIDFKTTVPGSSPSELYKEFIEIVQKPTVLLTKDDIERFNDIIAQIEVKDKVRDVKFIGDMLADRNGNDYFTLKLLETLSNNGLNFKVTLSNHDAKFMDEFDALNKAAFAGSKFMFLNNQGQSMTNLNAMIEFGLAKKEEIQGIFNDIYCKKLTLIDYSYSPESDKLSLWTHARIGLEEIANLAKEWKISVPEMPLEKIANVEWVRIIQEINKKFDHEKRNENRDNFKAMIGVENRDPAYDETSVDSRKKYPLLAMFWNRAYDGLVSTDKQVFIHGHDSDGPRKTNVVCIDNSFAKNADRMTATFETAGMVVTNAKGEVVPFNELQQRRVAAMRGEVQAAPRQPQPVSPSPLVLPSEDTSDVTRPAQTGEPQSLKRQNLLVQLTEGEVKKCLGSDVIFTPTRDRNPAVVTLSETEPGKCFNIHPDKLSTASKDVETFKAMLTSYKAIHEDSSYPKITAPNADVAELWRQACSQVYQGKDITIDIQSPRAGVRLSRTPM